MIKKFNLIILLSIIVFTISCSNTKYVSQDSYIVLDREGLSFKVFSTLKYKKEPQEDKLLTNLKAAKKLTRKELGQYHIIEPCFDKKDSIIGDIELKVNKLISNEVYFTEFQIDSIYIDDWIKKTIVTKFGEKYRIK